MIGASKSIWGFDPRSVPGCVVWLDAADSNTLTLSGSNITAWRDKSTFSNNVNSISAIPPTYNSADSSVNFVASSGTFLRGTMSATYSNSASVFVVASIASQSTPAFPRISSLGLSSTANSILVGQFLLVNGGNPSVITYLATNTNPSGQGTNIMTLVSNVTYNTKQLITNVSTRAVASATAFTISTLLNGNSQSTSVSTRTGNFTANATNIASYNKYSLANYPDAASTTGDSYNGKIFEYLVFNTALSVSDREHIEGYLAHKWGINTLLPTLSPYYSIKPHSESFIPYEFPLLTVWFDGADRSTMTFSGSSITSWRDKSSNNYLTSTMLGTFPTETTVNGNNAVSFIGRSTFTVSNVIFGSGLPTRTLFAVYRVPTSSNSNITLFGRGVDLGNPNGMDTEIRPLGAESYIQAISSGSSITSRLSASIPSVIGTTALIHFGHNTVAASNIVALNGTTYNTVSSSNANYPATTKNYYLGSAYNQPYILCEYLLYQIQLTVGERQRIEGYLAHKWGLTSSLPVNHPFKIIPSSKFLPKPLTLDGYRSNNAFIVKYDSNGIPLWARRTGGTGSNLGRSSKTDSSGNTVVVGDYTSNPLRIFAANGTTVSFSFANSSQDGFVVKYDSSGTPLWARRIGGTGVDIPTSVSTDSSGNIIVAGQYTSTTLNMFAANGTTVSFSLSGTGTTDAFIVKYDSNGTPLWARRITGTANEFVNSVSTDSSGNIIVAGNYNSTTTNIIAANGSTVSLSLTNSSTAGLFDAFIVKYDSNGTPLWGRKIGGTSNEAIRSVSTDSSGNIIVAGSHQSNPVNIFAANGSTVSLSLSNSGDVGTQDTFVVKYDSNGTPLWARRMGGNGNDPGISVTTDSSGNIIVAGWYISNPLSIFAANGSTVSFSLTNSGLQDGFVVKYDSSGTPLWARRIGGTDVESVNSVSTDSSGNIIVAGQYTSNTLNIFAADGTTVSFSLTKVGSSGGFVVKYDSSGTPLWARKITGTVPPNSDETANSVSTDSSGNIIVAGTYFSVRISFY